jgi:hypothetical protein
MGDPREIPRRPVVAPGSVGPPQYHLWRPVGPATVGAGNQRQVRPAPGNFVDRERMALNGLATLSKEAAIEQARTRHGLELRVLRGGRFTHFELLNWVLYEDAHMGDSFNGMVTDIHSGCCRRRAIDNVTCLEVLRTTKSLRDKSRHVMTQHYRESCRHFLASSPHDLTEEIMAARDAIVHCAADSWPNTVVDGMPTPPPQQEAQQHQDQERNGVQGDATAGN